VDVLTDLGRRADGRTLPLGPMALLSVRTRRVSIPITLLVEIATKLSPSWNLYGRAVSTGMLYARSPLTECDTQSVEGFDSSVHCSEEALNAAKAVPIGILGSTMLTAAIGWVLLIVLAFFMGYAWLLRPQRLLHPLLICEMHYISVTYNVLRQA
jgi:hypothetical protein